MLVCCAFFSPQMVLCVPSKQLNFSLICPQNILQVALWNIQVHFCKLAARFFWTAVASSVLSVHEQHSCLVFYVS